MIFELVILPFWSEVLEGFFQPMLASCSLQVRVPFGPHLCWFPTNRFISDPVGISVCTLTNAAPSLTAWVIWKQQRSQIESVSQTFVPSIINAPLLFSRSDPFNLFSITHFFSSSTNITRVASCFSVWFFTSCFPSDVFGVPLSFLSHPSFCNLLFFFPRS